MEKELVEDEVKPTKEAKRNASRAHLMSKNKKMPLVMFNRKNYLLHFYFIRRDFSACKALIKELLDECNEFCDYPMYIAGKIDQIEGEFSKALYWYKKAMMLNPKNDIYPIRIGQIHFLLGNHDEAANVLLSAIDKNPSLLQAYYWRAMSLYYDGCNEESIKKAQECLAALENINKSPEILKFMAHLFKKQNDDVNAARSYEQVLKLEPDHLEALTNLGLIYYQKQNENRAFEMFGKALSYDPTDGNAIIAAGSIIQTNGDFDVALAKYRVAAERCDYNGSLWNNIGMCFFGKEKFVAAISCLKKAYYLCPLDWKVSFNLGLVHYAIKQYASAFHFLSTAANLNPTYAMIYSTLAAVLTSLNDPANARKAYEKAIQLNNKNPQILYNYAVFELKQKNFDEAMKLAKRCDEYLPWNNQRNEELIRCLEDLKQLLSCKTALEVDNNESYI